MISVAEADAILNATLPRWPSERVPLDVAVGRVLQQTVTADRDSPPLHRVCMDGIAVHYDDYARGQRRFPIHGTQQAGDRPLAAPPAEACIEVMTGAVLKAPMAVVPVEKLRIADGVAELPAEGVERDQNLQAPGREHSTGATLLRPGTRLRAPAVAALASVGHALVEVTASPHICVAATGNELVPVTTMPEPWQLRMSNLPGIAAALRSAGYHRVQVEHWRDQREAMRDAVERVAATAQVLIVSGGISAGSYDFTAEALANAGVSLHFQKVAQKPGKPFAFGTGKGLSVFALPGNPVSALMCLHRYVIPWLRRAEGAPVPSRQVQLSESVRFAKPLAWFPPVRCAAPNRVTPVPHAGSGDWGGIGSADGFIEVQAEIDETAPEDWFPYYDYA